MDIKRLFLSIAAVLFSRRKFLQDFFSARSSAELNLQKDYALPVIAMVQLVKFPLVGTPRLAMYTALATFMLDIAALYLVTGGMIRLLGSGQAAASDTDAAALAAFSLTPLWLVEPFYYFGGWSWLFASVAAVYAVVILIDGINELFKRNPPPVRVPHANASLLLVVVSIALFVVERGIIRLIDTLHV
ncbi:MAG: hypothetical protein FJY09_10245 [Chlorobi bacterium]|nr:hypothetical protein [Chlorobiota bacterium]